MEKWVCRHTSQEPCPFNIKCSSALTEPAFVSRDGLESRGARVLARQFLVMSQAEFSARFKGSAMKRAKRRGLARNAAVVLGNVGTAEDVPLLTAALQHDEPLVREHAASALAHLRSAGDVSARGVSHFIPDTNAASRGASGMAE